MVVNVYRYFISQYPTFGSYKKPKPYLVEASPYFWWWYALTLNKTYSCLCDLHDSESLLTDSETDFPEAMLQVYKDFGDVRYEGCRYRAFAKWWRERVDTGETRGEYLFAEPKVEPAASRIVKEAEINAAIQCLDTIIISVNVKHQRQHIDAAISRILKRSLITTKGRKVRNPESSAARYHLPKSFNISALKKTFRVYELRIEGERSGKQITNYKIADMVGLSSKSDNIEIKDAAYENRKKSVQVSRHYRMANDIIDSVGCGGFVF